jgi:hypothetical protein
MLRLLLFAVLALGSAAAGGAAGIALRGPLPPSAGAEEEAVESEHVSLPGQFVIPLIENGRVTGHMVLTLGLSYDGAFEHIHAMAPRLRDAFNEALLIHAGRGHFRGDFTEHLRMNQLRSRLNDAARVALGDAARGVLIEQILRRDL